MYTTQSTALTRSPWSRHRFTQLAWVPILYAWLTNMHCAGARIGGERNMQFVRNNLSWLLSGRNWMDVLTLFAHTCRTDFRAGWAYSLSACLPPSCLPSICLLPTTLFTASSKMMLDCSNLLQAWVQVRHVHRHSTLWFAWVGYRLPCLGPSQKRERAPWCRPLTFSQWFSSGHHFVNYHKREGIRLHIIVFRLYCVVHCWV